MASEGSIHHGKSSKTSQFTLWQARKQSNIAVAMDTVPSRTHSSDLLPLAKSNFPKFLGPSKTVPSARDSSG